MTQAPPNESPLAALSACSALLDTFEDFGGILQAVERLPPSEGLDLVRGWHRHDLGAFGLTVFPDRVRSAFNALHLDLIAISKPAFWERHSEIREAVAAPRGSAKSTIVTFIDLVHDAIFGLEAFVGVSTNIAPLAEVMVADLFAAFSDPDLAPELHDLYGPFKVTGTKTDFVVKSLYGRRGGTCYRAYSIRSTVRGHRHNGYRFTKFIIDDGEHPERVKRPANRDADDQHIETDIAKAGEPGLWLRMFGTVLISDSVLQRKLNPEESLRWDGRKYGAILSWPDEREGLWEEGRAVWSDLSIGSAKERYSTLAAWYQANRDVLDRGARVLWPERKPLLELMIAYWSDPLAFWAEDMNEPRLSTDLLFDVEKLRYISFDGERIVRDDGSSVGLAQCSVRIFWDPKPEGQKDKGRDSAAWAVVARCPAGAYYVLHTYQVRADRFTQWLVTARILNRFPTALGGYENNGGSLEGVEEWVKFCHEHGITGRIRGYQSHGASKSDRIADMQPATLNGFLRFARSDIDPDTYNQLRHWPRGKTDDIIDAIERAKWLHSIGHVAVAEVYR